MAAHYQEFVVHVARALAEQPERVQVEELPAADGARGSNLRLVVAPEDVGRLVGRRGRTANALRTLLSISGACDLEITGSDEAGDEPEDDRLE